MFCVKVAAAVANAADASCRFNFAWAFENALEREPRYSADCEISVESESLTPIPLATSLFWAMGNPLYRTSMRNLLKTVYTYPTLESAADGFHLHVGSVAFFVFLAGAAETGVVAADGFAGAALGDAVGG